MIYDLAIVGRLTGRDDRSGLGMYDLSVCVIETEADGPRSRVGLTVASCTRVRRETGS
jgi:hypothetical protein